jgi:heat shock protein HtpX
LFATHPSVQSRVDALVKFAGGHDPGPLPDPAEETDQPGTEQPEAQANPQDAQPLPHGPWNDTGNPAGPPPVPAPGPSGAPAGNAMGPWGRH